jgi:hypothetical protein
MFGLPTGPTHRRWVDIIARPGTSVIVDGAAVPAASFQPVGSGEFLRAQVELQPVLTHSILADRPIAAYAGALGPAVAMTYPVDIAPPPNLPPVCNTGGPYTAACDGPTTDVALSAAASSDPEGAPLSFSWSSPDPELSFDDTSLPAPRVTVAGSGSFALVLEVSDGALTTPCSTTLSVPASGSPPGELSLPPAPLWLVRRGADLVFSFEDLGTAPLAYNLYAGILRSTDSHLPLACGVSGAAVPPGRRETSRPFTAGNAYYLVSASNCLGEGPTGNDPGQSTCPP